MKQPCTDVKLWELAYNGQFALLKEKLHENPALAQQKIQDERQVLHWACAGGHNDIVEHLFEVYDVPVDEADDSGWTPLLIASSAGHQQIVHELLRKNADPNKTTFKGQSALHYAASKDRYEITAMLLGNGADVNVPDISTNATPLHRAASKGNLKIVKLLLEHGCKVGPQDCEGNTPLHLACEEERTETAELLVQHDASVTCQNKVEKTPIDLSPPYLKRRLLGE